MGRKKISIQPIKDERNRQVTLNKRKLGLMKKAYELSVLCECEIAVVIFDSHERNYIFGSHEVGTTLSRYVDFKDDPVESHNNETISKVCEASRAERLSGRHCYATSWLLDVAGGRQFPSGMAVFLA